MTISAEKTVRELALENPAATRVFEKLGIDYCCSGGRSLEEACRAANLPVREVTGSLEAAAAAAQAPAAPDRDWQKEPLADLAAHIINRHHRFVRDELTRLGPLFEKVCSVHGKNHPELLEMRTTFHGLAQELTMHMMKEEKVLFPYICRMEESVIQKEPVLPAPFGTVQNPVAMMIHEHDSAGDALRVLRESSKVYTAPADACASFRTLYQALTAFELTCTSTFIWRTTSCFHVRLHSRREAEGGHDALVSNRSQQWSDANTGGSVCDHGSAGDEPLAAADHVHLDRPCLHAAARHLSGCVEPPGH
jgi:regulator of cell morphogenesis and NO signaling